MPCSSIWRLLMPKTIQQCGPEIIAMKLSPTALRMALIGTNWMVCIWICHINWIRKPCIFLTARPFTTTKLNYWMRFINACRRYARFQLCDFELFRVDVGTVLLQIPKCQRTAIGMVAEQTKSHRVHEIEPHGYQRCRHRLESLSTWRHRNHSRWTRTETSSYHGSRRVLAFIITGTVSCASGWFWVSTIFSAFLFESMIRAFLWDRYNFRYEPSPVQLVTVVKNEPTIVNFTLKTSDAVEGTYDLFA